MAKVNTTEYRDGGLEFAKRIGIYISSKGGITPQEFAHELASFENAQYENVTPQQLDLTTSRQATAQNRELIKTQEIILANDQKLIESHAKLSAIYHPQRRVVDVLAGEQMKSDAFDMQYHQNH